MRIALKVASLAAMISLSCSVVLQDGVRSSGTECSESRFYYLTDLLAAAAWTGVIASRTVTENGVSMQANGPVAYTPAALLVGSALIGIYKRNHCVGYRKAHPPLVNCNSGGQRDINNACYCAHGQSWSGTSCQGAPSADTCTGGAYAFGPPAATQCFCLDGYTFDNGQCVALNCTGGMVALVNSCVCPLDTSWNGTECAAPPPPALQTCADGTQAETCPATCPDDMQLSEDGTQCLPADSGCTGGAVRSGDDCACPDGTQWDGAACSAPPAGTAPEPEHHRQRPRHNPPRPSAPQPSAPQPSAPQPTMPRPVVQHAPTAPRQRAPVYSALFQANASAAKMSSCQTFDAGADNMTACSRFCTGYMAQKLDCRCANGACP